jgi:hypothetical protein
LPAIFWGFLLECHDQIHNVPWLGPAVQKIAELYKCGFASCPVVLLVNEAALLKYCDEVLKIAMNVCDGRHRSGRNNSYRRRHRPSGQRPHQQRC